MAKTIRINHEGDGQWIMDRAGGVFSPGYDHAFMTMIDDVRAGGFVLCQYLGNSMTVHMAGVTPRWCSRDLLWMVFDYPFNVLGVGKLIAPVRSDNATALRQDTRAGWVQEAVIRDVYAPGVDVVILAMTRETCPWLKLKPTGWQRGTATQEPTHGQ